MKNLFKPLFAKLEERRRKSAEREIDYRVNHDIIIANDKNDPDNGIYVWVCGVPIAMVDDNEVKAYVKQIKCYYSRKLKNECINGQGAQERD